MNNSVADDAATILHKSIGTGAGYQMNYLEIYQVDVLNLRTRSRTPTASNAARRGLLDALARGDSFGTALSYNYGSRFSDIAALEGEFVPYVTFNAKPSATPN
jgi:hypothetical protein